MFYYHDFNTSNMNETLESSIIKPLMIIFLGIDRSIDEFDLNPSITKYMSQYYDIINITTPLDTVHDDIEDTLHDNADIIVKNIENLLIQANYVCRPNLLFLAHSFGCILCLHTIKKLITDMSKISLIFIDPTSQYTKNYVKKISDELILILDSVPTDVKCKTLIFTYYCIVDHPKYKSKKNSILKLFDDDSNVTIKSLYVKPKSKIIPHDLHIIYPKLILEEIKEFCL